MPTKTVTAIALKDFDCFRVGDKVTTTPLEAAMLSRKRFVSLTRQYKTRELISKDPEPEPQPEQPKRRGRRRRDYRRTDMQAEE